MCTDNLSNKLDLLDVRCEVAVFVVEADFFTQDLFPLLLLEVKREVWRSKTNPCAAAKYSTAKIPRVFSAMSRRRRPAKVAIEHDLLGYLADVGKLSTEAG
ncbi:hypothetical protein OH492_08950 [Vibrio chagasii]|nr:hypothetical protein [Vibrio chagasii]